MYSIDTLIPPASPLTGDECCCFKGLDESAEIASNGVIFNPMRSHVRQFFKTGQTRKRQRRAQLKTTFSTHDIHRPRPTTATTPTNARVDHIHKTAWKFLCGRIQDCHE